MGVSSYEFNSIDAAPADKRQHRRHVIRRAVAEPDGDALMIRPGFLPAHLCRVELVVLHKRGIEAAHAGKAARQGNLGDCHIRIGQQLLGLGQRQPEAGDVAQVAGSASMTLS